MDFTISGMHLAIASWQLFKINIYIRAKRQKVLGFLRVVLMITKYSGIMNWAKFSVNSNPLKKKCHGLIHNIWKFPSHRLNLNQSCNLDYSCGYAGSFSPLCQARDQTHTSAATQVTAVAFLAHCPTAGTPRNPFIDPTSVYWASSIHETLLIAVLNQNDEGKKKKDLYGGGGIWTESWMMWRFFIWWFWATGAWLS